LLNSLRVMDSEYGEICKKCPQTHQYHYPYF